VILGGLDGHDEYERQKMEEKERKAVEAAASSESLV
jgi:hypothetical protein